MIIRSWPRPICLSTVVIVQTGMTVIPCKIHRSVMKMFPGNNNVIKMTVNVTLTFNHFIMSKNHSMDSPL